MLPPPCRRTAARVARTAPLLSLLAVSCSLGGSHSPTASPTSSAQARAQFASGTFVTAIPPGWSDKTRDQSAVLSINVDSGTVVMLLLAPPTAAGLNEHIDVSTPSPSVPDDQLEMYLESVAQNGATNLSQAEPFDLDGNTGVFITYDVKPNSSGVMLEAQDMFVNHSGNTYEIVLNTAQADFATQLPALQKVLSAWRWTA